MKVVIVTEAPVLPSFSHYYFPESSRRDNNVINMLALQEDPKFEGETPSCEYVFSWRTPSACAQVVSDELSSTSLLRL